MASKKPVKAKKPDTRDAAASKQIDRRMAGLDDWRGKTLARVRRIITKADPGIVEEWKWVKASSPGVPVWSHHGIICTGETYKDKLKLTFAKGALLEDPSGLFNASLDGNVRRAIDVHEKDMINEDALAKLVREAIALNLDGKPAKKSDPPALLTGGNPQIAKEDGDAPVQAYIAAMPGWKRDLGRRLDALIARNAPRVRKAVKWNSPFYGIEGRGWFVSFHVFTRYVKVTFFKGTLLRPVPPGGKGEEARWIDIHENDFDEAQMVKWIKQASNLPGWGKS